MNILLRYISKDVIKMILLIDDFEILREILILIVSCFGYIDIVMKLVKEGVDVNVFDYFYILLVYVCMMENLLFVE